MKNSIGVNLNQLEINKMIKIINELKPDKTIIDCPSHNEKRIKALFEARTSCEIICECKADEKYPIVGAGSIIAKQSRDNMIKDLEKRLGAIIGAGYPSDDRTIDFAKKALSKPEWLLHVRHSWQTYIQLKSKKEQSTLNEF
jgi:ribonuclease HII